MKQFVKCSQIGLFLCLFLFCSCSKEEVDRHEIEGNWTVVSFEDFESPTSITKTEENTWSDYNNGDITVNFSVTNNRNGKITGKKVTNTFSGDFTIGSDQELIVHDILGTEISEPEWARMFHNILLAESYDIDDNRLVIYYNNGKNGIVLTSSEK